jgi:phage tail protein X
MSFEFPQESPALLPPEGAVAALLENSMDRETAVHSLTLDPAPSARDRAGQMIVVKAGDTVEKLARRIYGRSNESIIRMIQDNNPEIKNIDFILPGQVLLFAVIEEPGQ